MDLVEAGVLENGEAIYYFRNSVTQNMPDDAGKALRRLADGKTPKIDRQTKRWLRRRMLITEDERLMIPVMERWMKEYWI